MIALMTEAWGGRNNDAYRNEPPRSEKNYKEKVLDLKPDLIVSEFVNDMFMDEATVAKKYGEILNDFNGIGADWIILGPHYVRPDWMGLTSERDCDVDPRHLVKGLRAFALDKQIPYADASTLYGKMWRAGIPYNTLMTNNINHPNNFGMEISADALRRLFEESPERLKTFYIRDLVRRRGKRSLTRFITQNARDRLFFYLSRFCVPS